MNDKIIPITSDSGEMMTSTPIHSKFTETEDAFTTVRIDPSQYYSHPQFEQPPIIRTNQRLVSSLLHMGQLLQLNKPKTASENDFVVNSLETITSLMDNVYLITKFGIGKNSKFLSKVSSNASKVWFVTLLFSLRKIFKDLLRLYNLKGQVWREIRLCGREQHTNPLARLILQKYELKVQDIKSEITSEIFELIGSLNDLLFVSIEIFKWKLPRWIEKLIGYISAAMMFYRMSRRS